MAYKVIILYQLYMPSYFLGTFTEYPYLLCWIGIYPISGLLIRLKFYLGIFSKCPYKIQWHMKMPQYNHFICHFYCHFSVFSHILL